MSQHTDVHCSTASYPYMEQVGFFCPVQGVEEGEGKGVRRSLEGWWYGRLIRSERRVVIGLGDVGWILTPVPNPIGMDHPDLCLQNCRSRSG